MGFPGELESQYPGKIWAAFNFYDVAEGRRVFGLGDEPKLIPITGTVKAKIPAGKMFFTGRYNDRRWATSPMRLSITAIPWRSSFLRTSDKSFLYHRSLIINHAPEELNHFKPRSIGSLRIVARTFVSHEGMLGRI